LFKDGIARGELIGTKETLEAPPPGEWAGVLEHERIPVISYPYEWTFSMLRDAALLQLTLFDAALNEDLTMKDATPYNVQFRGACPTFIDIGSFRRLTPGEPWLGYRQFCMQFLYPLMLRAYKDVPFQPWMRGRLEGISASDIRELMSPRDLLRKGVLLHVALQARAERRLADSERDIREELRAAGFRTEMIQANLARLRKIVTAMHWHPKGAWKRYASGYEHVEQDRPSKSAFVEAVLTELSPRTVWDLGTNDGHFARLAAGHADFVVAMDMDEPVIDQLYQALHADGERKILPLVVDLTDSSPGLGWEGTERNRLEQRGRPELVLSLALIHHLVITKGIPLPRIVSWLASLNAAVVLEYVDRDDPLVLRLAHNRLQHEIHRYDEAFLRGELQRHFRVEREMRLPSGHRTLFLLRPQR